MTRSLLVIVIALAVPAIATVEGASAQVREIETGDDFFNPEKAFAFPGNQTFRWTWSTANQHNVRQDDKLFYSGGPATSGQFTVLPSAGTFGYYCEVHGAPGVGMDGELRITPLGSTPGTKAKPRAKLIWATPETNTGSQFDVRQTVGKGKPELVEEKTREFEGSFKLKPGKRYGFQVRSWQGKAVSDWSPTVFLKR